jgi:hypothetical protein
VPGELYPCCQEPDNLVLQPQDPTKPGLELRVCGACGRRHFELTVDPVELGLTVSPL